MSNWKKLRHHVLHNGFDRYQRNAMSPLYLGEEKANTPVRYLTANEKEQHKLIIKGGLILKQDKTLLSTSDAKLSGNFASSALYAIDLNGHFYAIMKSDTGAAINHSTLLAGESVLCAGFISVQKGKLISISNCSGHYKPSLGALFKCISLLRKGGIDLKSFSVFYETPTSRCPVRYPTALQFISSVPYPAKNISSIFVQNRGISVTPTPPSPSPLPSSSPDSKFTFRPISPAISLKTLNISDTKSPSTNATPTCSPFTMSPIKLSAKK